MDRIQNYISVVLHLRDVYVLVFFYKVVGLVGGGSVINEAYPVQFLEHHAGLWISGFILHQNIIVPQYQPRATSLIPTLHNLISWISQCLVLI